MPDITIEVNHPAVTINQNSVSVDLDFGGPTGPPGPEGPAGGTSETYPAGQNLSAGRVVIIDGGEAFYFQPSDPTHAGRAFGVTITSALTGEDVDIQTAGVVTDVAFVFSGDLPVWVGADGELSTTVPTSGLLQQAGSAVAANSLRLNLTSTIKI